MQKTLAEAGDDAEAMQESQINGDKPEADSAPASTGSTRSNGSSFAHEMAKTQRDIGVAEFFARNRHLLGFDNKKKALLTTIKEAVDNSLDACEEASILPEISVEVIDMDKDRFRIIVEDNGPGIVKEQIPKIFAKLLYGSKFHRLRMSRGQQGIGISASVMYGQLTTGRPAKIVSKIDPVEPAHYYELRIDTQKNRPEIVKEATMDWPKEHGTRIELDIEASYAGGTQSVDQYLKETAIVNPHVTIIYTNPKAQQIIFPRATEIMPNKTEAIKPHPYGVELGVLQDMLKLTESKTLQSFLMNEFSRVGAGTAKQICENAALLPRMRPKQVSREAAEKLMQGIKETKIIAPSNDCIAPIGREQIEKGLKKEINAEFYIATTRSPSVYRGNPFIIEAGIAYGGQQQAEGPVTVMRFANRVPLLYQQGACAANKSIISTNWRPYGLSQSSGSLPQGACTIMVHIASVWVPFTSESKEAIAHYPEIVKEIRIALQECGRQLGSYLNKKKKVSDELKKRNYIEKYIPHVSAALREIIGLKPSDEENLNSLLKVLLEKHRGAIDDMKFDPNKNTEYDRELAGLGRPGSGHGVGSDDDDLTEESEDYEDYEGPKGSKGPKGSGEDSAYDRDSDDERDSDEGIEGGER
ncbi:DNA topoisomerase VI subunit B [Candidatus Woesearchaeota archaeon]|nr:DNA topoisomerase VI subunit B [Candidatus Woesearchaeota archaeon]